MSAIRDAMVDRFLQWKFPEDFCPDGHIHFDQRLAIETPFGWPVGTNLLTAEQAGEMVDYMLDRMAPKTEQPMKFSVQELRTEVLAFALLMEWSLRQHDADKKQTWKNMSIADLCVHAFSKATRMESERLDLRHPVDLANYCMFIADVSGALEAGVREAEGTEGNGGPGWEALDQVQMS